jgi:hypothetical protein
LWISFIAILRWDRVVRVVLRWVGEHGCPSWAWGGHNGCAGLRVWWCSGRLSYSHMCRWPNQLRRSPG